MSMMVWTALLVGAWCVASTLAALVVGPTLRRRAATRAAGHDASGVPTVAMPRPRPGHLDPLDTGPMRMWLAELPEVPEPRRSSPSPAP